MDTHRIGCSEIWGGVRSIDLDVCTGGLTASVYSRACDGDAGGDIYYLSVCSSDRLTRIALADVRGHGGQVSQISSWIYDSLKLKMNTLDGAGVLADLNNQIYRHGLEAMTTASVVGYYITESRLYFSYAGHSPALLWRRAEKKWELLPLSRTGGTANMVLGVLPSACFDQEHTPFASGDRFILYTDGVTECPDKNGDEFGLHRMADALEQADGDSLRNIKSSVVEALRRHAAPEQSHDDITFMIAEIR